MGLGAWSFLEEYPETDLKKFQNIADFFVHISLALIILGMIVFWMSFAGCLGALRENLCFLKLVSWVVELPSISYYNDDLTILSVETRRFL